MTPIFRTASLSVSLSAALLIAAGSASSASAECRHQEIQDDITLEVTQYVFCGESAPSLAVTCDGNQTRALVQPGPYVGGDFSNVVFRGDTQETPQSFRASVASSGVIIIVPDYMSPRLITSLLESSNVFIRFSDYRDVSDTVEISAQGFTAAAENLPCVVNMLAPAAAPAAPVAPAGEAPGVVGTPAVESGCDNPDPKLCG
jgi:hypothetical protein